MKSSTEAQILEIGNLYLHWSDWYDWDDVARDGRKVDAIQIPNKTPGVYEVKLKGSSKRLTIGKTNNLRYRIRQALVRGIAPHSSGKNIRLKEDISKIEIRWAITERPSAAEEELHRLYKMNNGTNLPMYTKRT